MQQIEHLIVAAALASTGCDRVFQLDRPPPDAPVTTIPFNTPVPLSLNSAGPAERPTLTDDQLELYFHVGGQLFRSVRPAIGTPWGASEPLTELNEGDVRRPCISADGMLLYFSKGFPGSQFDILVSARAARTTPWGTPIALPAPVNNPTASEFCGWSSRDGHQLLYSSNFLAGGDDDIHRAIRKTKDDPYEVVEFTDLNSNAPDGAPWAIDNGTLVMFDTGRFGGSQDIVEARLNGLSWSFAMHPELNTPANEGSVWLSPDGSVIYFSSDRDGTSDIFMATRGTAP